MIALIKEPVFKTTPSIDKTKIFYELIQKNRPFWIKGTPDSVISMKPTHLDETHKLWLEFTDYPIELNDQEQAVCHFQLGAEKYFFVAHFKKTNNGCIVHLNEPLYQLQRRQNYRLPIPDSYKAFFNIKKNELSLKVKDISATGCRIISTDTDFRLNDEIQGELKIGKRDPIKLTCVIRHIQQDPSHKNQFFWGTEFKYLSKIAENRLFALTMDLHRELFKILEK